MSDDPKKSNVANPDQSQSRQSPAPASSQSNNSNPDPAGASAPANSQDLRDQTPPDDDTEDVIKPLSAEVNPFGKESPYAVPRNIGFSLNARRAFKRFDRTTKAVQPCELWEYQDPRFVRDGRL